MGDSTTLIFSIIIVLLAIAVGVLIVLFLRMQRKLKTFMVGKDGMSLEATLSWLTTKIAEIDDGLGSHKEALEVLDGRIARSIRGYSLVRYNAYMDAGGEQSFASGLLDEHGDGFILSVITNRNHVGVYAKKVIAGTPEVTLTQEEKQALAEAKAAII
jgi:hypothetical protein